MTARLIDMSRGIQTRLKQFFDTTLEGDAAPLEIAQAALDDVERHVQPAGRGRRVFPYRQLIVQVRQRDPEHAPIGPAFDGFDARVRDRLSELRCQSPRSLEVRVTGVAADDWKHPQPFTIEYVADTSAGVRPAANGSSPAVNIVVNIVVIRGAAVEPSYSFSGPAISIGRSTDASDELGRTRRNRVAFLDTIDGVTETVGRAHACLKLDEAGAGYELFDEGSRNGTSIVRNGESIAVHPRDPRGVRVRSGDEILIGRAMLRVEIDG